MKTIVADISNTKVINTQWLKKHLDDAVNYKKFKTNSDN